MTITKCYTFMCAFRSWKWIWSYFQLNYTTVVSPDSCTCHVNLFFPIIYRMLRREQFIQCINGNLNWIKTDRLKWTQTNNIVDFYRNALVPVIPLSFIFAIFFEIYVYIVDARGIYRGHPVYIWPCRWWKQFSIIFYDTVTLYKKPGVIFKDAERSISF